MPKEQSGIKERRHTHLQEPKQYNVFIHNDDFTTMEFVVEVLRRVFFHSEENAVALMLKVHHSEKAVAGTYTYDVAMSKKAKATRMAQEEGFPLRLSLEPAEN